MMHMHTLEHSIVSLMDLSSRKNNKIYRNNENEQLKSKTNYSLFIMKINNESF